MSSASNAARPTTPNQPEKAKECPGAPMRLRPAGLTVDTAPHEGHRLVFEDPRQAPGAPHKANVSAELRDMSAAQKLFN